MPKVVKKTSLTIEWNSNDFLTAGVQNTRKRKQVDKSAGGKGKKRNTADAAEWRGHMTVTLKAASSVKEGKSATTAESLSTTVGEQDHLVFFGDSLLQSHLLTPEESKSLQDREKKFEKKFGEKPAVSKLQWRDRNGASLLGLRSQSGAKFLVESAKTAPQQCALRNGDTSLWIGAAKNLERIALKTVKGDKDNLLCVVPEYKGVARLSVKGDGSGGQSLRVSPDIS